MKYRTYAGALAVAGLLGVMLSIGGVCNQCLAGDSTDLSPSVKRSGPVADLPSPPGPHIEKIKALGADQWLDLGSPAADPKWGRARGRAWGGRAFAFAPDIHGAYFTGEGVHAFVKPDGHGMDDYWVYDINAHRWICIYPGTNTKTFNKRVKSGDLKVNEHGVVVDKEGNVVVGHLIIHAWGYLAYDTDRKKFTILHCGSGFSNYYMPGGKDVAGGLATLGEQKKTKPPAPLTPVAIDTATGKFECGPAADPYPGRGVMGPHPNFLYLSGSRQFVAVGKGRTALYDPQKTSWTMVKTTGPCPTGGDTGACYDPKRHRVYAGKLDKARKPGQTATLVIYDARTSAWSEAAATGEYPQTWSNSNLSLNYDSANDVVVIFHYTDRRVYIYDPAADAWRKPVAMPAEWFARRKAGNAFYDPELNAHFVFMARDSADDGVMRVYRYGKGAAAQPTTRPSEDPVTTQ